MGGHAVTQPVAPCRAACTLLPQKSFLYDYVLRLFLPMQGWEMCQVFPTLNPQDTNVFRTCVQHLNNTVKMRDETTYSKCRENL